MNCPVCDGVKMREIEKENVLIDVCPNCKGVWLDRGELEKITQGLREDQSYYNDAYKANDPSYQSYPKYDSKSYDPKYSQYNQYDKYNSSHSYDKYGKYNKYDKYDKYGHPHHKHKRKKSMIDILSDFL